MRSPTLLSITGTANEALAFHKFMTFALVASLLVPNAATLFKRALKDERSRYNGTPELSAQVEFGTAPAIKEGRNRQAVNIAPIVKKDEVSEVA